MYTLFRSLLFHLEPERAHHAALAGLTLADRLGLAQCWGRQVPGSPSQVMGLTFPNPVGLAAGLDKNGDYIDALAALGFGFIEIGTVTPRPQSGNPPPRLFRLPQAQAIINRMGFNNRGVDYLVGRVCAARYKGVLGINIGKNFDTPVERALDDYLIGLRKVYAHASYVTVNISSPNTPGLRQLQGRTNLDNLLRGLKAEQGRLAQVHGRYVPLMIKIAPDLEREEIVDIAHSVCEQGVDGVIATNTTVSRVGVEGLPHAEEAGGLSGAPLMGKSTDVVRVMRAVLGSEVLIIAAGGILSAQDAAEKMRAGANLVQIYTGFIYRGPLLVREIAVALAR